MSDSDTEEQFDFAMGGASLESLGKDDAFRLATKMASNEFSGVDSKTMEGAQEKAKELVSGLDQEGLKQLQDLAKSTVMPVVCLALKHIASAHHRGSALTKLQTEIDKLAPANPGCIQLDIAHNGTTDVAYILLDECPKDYDFGLELNGLLCRIPTEKKQEILTRCSMLFNNGRYYYAHTIKDHLKLLRKLANLPGDDPCNDYLTLNVDKVNTTLYVNPSWPRRIGIRIRYRHELPAE